MKKHSLRITCLATTTMLLALAGCDGTGPAKTAEDDQTVEDSGLPLPMPAPETTPENTLPEKNAMPGAPPPPGDIPPTEPPPTAGSAQ